LAKATETVLETVQRSCYSGQCNGKITYQRLIRREEEGQPVRKVFECSACGKRDPAPAGVA
jgi:hypothetical protein